MLDITLRLQEVRLNWFKAKARLTLLHYITISCGLQKFYESTQFELKAMRCSRRYLRIQKQIFSFVSSCVVEHT